MLLFFLLSKVKALIINANAMMIMQLERRAKACIATVDVIALRILECFHQGCSFPVNHDGFKSVILRTTKQFFKEVHAPCPFLLAWTIALNMIVSLARTTKHIRVILTNALTVAAGAGATFILGQAVALLLRGGIYVPCLMFRLRLVVVGATKQS